MNRMSSRLGLAAILALTIASVAGVQAEGQREGIKVHGHWAFEIRNADGTLASRQEFENALTAGAAVMAKLLTRQSALTEWAIGVGSPNGASPFAAGPSDLPPVLAGFAGLILEATSVSDVVAGFSFHNMTVSAGPNNTVVLKGSATAVRAGQIGSVATIAVCNSNCGPSGDRIIQFSGTDVTQALVAEQTVLITVTISFS